MRVIHFPVVQSVLLALVVTLGTSSALGHDEPASTQFNLLIPGHDLAGAITFVTLIGPPAGDEVLHTTFNLTYTSPPGGTPASDIVLELSFLLDGVGWTSWDVHGTDLGWPSENGTFSGTLDSDVLNGVMSAGLFGFSTPDLHMGSVTGGIFGKFLDSTVTLEIAGTETCQTDLGFAGPGTVSLSLCGDPLATGGSATLEVEGAPAFAPVHFVVSPFFSPTPFKGGTLVPVPIVLLFSVPSDAAGAVSLPVPGGGGPATIFIQAIVPDAAQVQGFALSNALQIELLP